MNNNSKSGLWKVALVALISAFLGVGLGFWGFSHFDNHQSTSTQSVTDNSGKAGTTKISNVTVKSNNQMTNAFKKVKGSVVSVINYQREEQDDNSLGALFGSLYGNGNGGSDNSQDQQGDDSDSKDQSKLQESSEGSGVIYAKQDGKAYIATNNHVVSGSQKLEVILSDGSKITAKKVGTDSITDLAVLSISADKVKSIATFGNSDAINPGESVIAIGSPLGSQYATSVTEGIISAKNRTIDTTDEKTGQKTGQATVLQTDTAINPGNSGGPLVNAAGQVIGINSMKLASSTNGTSVEGMGFAIPSNEVVKIINQLVQNGKIERPSLGIKVADLDQVPNQQQQSVLKLPDNVNSGVLVYSVTDNSVAKAAGLKKYDVIVALNDKKVDNIADLHTQLYNHSVGDTVKLSFYRDGKEQTVSLKLTKAD
ncbi:trypsin-like peptidase domain-containing protein [Bombilactobacillus folatiphilus]|uniref:Trypsin-like peptidase domain-containing protein n=1 Tax=Bombilactobacillus folatiphilus TaxID=2923362 RepID=A0ABY4P8Q2_9LACO|nr:trypsin-like peptidase domain-containing protein [Bombilactobacillus folatiphilus]UQS82099.1 trypsin-like peptidase domain-containing protein [Bombilactobacillus folatiphilus]